MVDYSRWANIEVFFYKYLNIYLFNLIWIFDFKVSDDEDDTHPNIDTPSLFRWRHQARVDRMEELAKEKQEFEEKKKSNQKQRIALQEKINKSADKEQLQKQLKVLEAESEKLKIEEDKVKRKEKNAPLNVDTLSQPGFAKTVVNKKPDRPKYEDMTEEEKEMHMKNFVKENKPIMEKYGMMRKYDDTKKFLLENHQLVCEDTANYLVIWCINLEMEKKHELMTHVAHQCICMQYILELSKQLDVDPRACVGSFCDRIQVADNEYKRQFDDEVKAFIARIVKRGEEKYAEAVKEAEEEERLEREARLGPGGLDPMEVYETLPQVCI